MNSNPEASGPVAQQVAHQVPPCCGLSLLDVLTQRSRFSKCDISGVVEDSLIATYDSIDYDLNPTMVRSTIAIAISPDGATVATTHGDHTVKIFKYADSTLYRVFNGHPRTPWTVKYHHTNPDIVASGCLGFEVFVWCISENCKVNSVRYSNSIISLSFQPHGPYIAVASGVELRLWNWAENASLCIDGSSGHILTSKRYVSSKSSKKVYPRMKIVKHARNIRAVLFHPFGRVLFAAAPDVVKNDNPMIYSRLYAFEIDSLAIPTGAPDDVSFELQLTTLPHILPQVHLYSDGGLDISLDGTYLLVCSILYHRPDFRLDLKELGFSPGTSARHGLDEVSELVSGISGLTLNDKGSVSKGPIHVDSFVEVAPEGYVPQSHLCLYKFKYKDDPAVESPDAPAYPASYVGAPEPPGFKNACLSEVPLPEVQLQEYRSVSTSLLKAITSVKLSPTCRYGLLGYGVRVDGFVEAHEYQHVASEVVNLRRKGLPMVTVMTDELDEVNIAQFHPLPGGGLIYGTKRGRVRVFRRASSMSSDES